MKVAIPVSGNLVDGHFGHCESFAIFSVADDKTIVEEEKITPPPGCGCKSNIIPVLAQMGVKVMLAGNMGGGALNMLEAAGIQVVRGCAGEALEAVTRWVNGEVVDSGEGCSEHGDHDCHNP